MSYSPPYAVEIIDTAAVTGRVRLGSTSGGTPVDYVTVLDLPVGADVLISFGESGQEIPLFNPIPFDICPPVDTGVYFRVRTAGAGLVTLLLSFGGVAGGDVP
jgi:hypothetical protein